MIKYFSVKKLLDGVEYKTVSGDPLLLQDLILHDITSDSRKAGEESLFFAIPGVHADGHDFIGDAIGRGVKVVVVQGDRWRKQQSSYNNICFLEVKDSAYAYAVAAANSNDCPSKKMKFIGVTGTNGKTTITYLLEDILSKIGLQVGVIGTVNNRYVDENGKQVVLPTNLTTPGAKTLQALFAKMAAAGVTHVIMEVSSHAIAQSRVAGIKYDLAAFTNLSRDHLDYHAGMEDYLATKCRLFTDLLKPDGIAIIPSDDMQLADGLLPDLQFAVSDKKKFTWGMSEDADVRLEDFDIKLSGTKYKVHLDGESFFLNTFLVGRFNIDNLLVTLGVCHGLGLDLVKVKKEIEQVKGAPGRIERVVDPTCSSAKQPVVFVDYAHTPDALDKLLSTLKSVPHNELIAVYGCGGDRDNGKRPVMGGVGAKHSDVVIITNDNPRTEEPERILGHVVQGVKAAGFSVFDESWFECREHGEKGCVVISDRRAAIRAAVRLAGISDIVAIAGKGHEPYQLTNLGKRFFDDRLEVLEILNSWTLDKVVAAVGGRFVGSSHQSLLKRVVTDSRAVRPGDIFIALVGETHDGHQFIAQAVEAGAACLVVEKAGKLNCPQIVVENTMKALGDLANFRRRKLAEKPAGFAPRIIGLTGSSGKTTTKEMVSSILSKTWAEKEFYPEETVLKTQGNFNNLIGLPLSLLPITIAHRAAVLEMGMNDFGEIARLTKIAEPDICCILNIQNAHLEGLGSIDGVARAKGELYQNSPEHAVFIVNLDDEKAREQAEKYPQKRITFSVTDKNADFYLSEISSPQFNIFQYTLHVKGERYPICLHVPGRHNVGNSLAAAAIAYAAGASALDIVAGLAEYRSPEKRMQCLETMSGAILINDCYNANPSSMKAAIKTLAESTAGKRIAILGDMFELGEQADTAHKSIGSFCGEMGLSELLVVGRHAESVAGAAISAGMKAEAVTPFAAKELLHSFLTERNFDNELERGDVVLVKGSRGMKMETVLPYFTG